MNSIFVPSAECSSDYISPGLRFSGDRRQQTLKSPPLLANQT
ncbi:hypothetical protein [Leptothermofonsia sichuanensis]|nr:hypothetical protein [Leptothermofonsia sichuanensis]